MRPVFHFFPAKVAAPQPLITVDLAASSRSQA